MYDFRMEYDTISDTFFLDLGPRFLYYDDGYFERKEV